MPTYTFVNKETNERFDKFMSISERDEYLKSNPQIEQALNAPSIGDPVRLGVKRTPDGFQQLLNHAKKSHKDSTIQSRY
jgi:hypothetical protein